MLSQRRAVELTLVIGVLVLFFFVPVLRDHRSAITTSYFVVVITVGIIRGRPEGIRILTLSIFVAVLAIAVSVLALWLNVWLGLAFIITVPTMALVIAYRRDQRAAMH